MASLRFFFVILLQWCVDDILIRFVGIIDLVPFEDESLWEIAVDTVEVTHLLFMDHVWSVFASVTFELKDEVLSAFTVRRGDGGIVADLNLPMVLCMEY